MKEIVIIGATSAVAQELAKLHAKAGDKLILCGRNSQMLEDIAADLKIRGAEIVEVISQDLVEFSEHGSLVEKVYSNMPHPWGVYLAHGTLPDQESCEDTYESTLKAIQDNALSQVSLLTLIANRMVESGSGRIATITSVAGDRGRQSNYVYGAAKGMLSIYLQGLRNRLQSKGVHVLTVKPGLIDTPMTADFEKKGLLWATPQKVASDIFRAMEKHRNVIYTPSFWWLIMVIIKHIPEPIFKKLRL